MSNIITVRGVTLGEGLPKICVPLTAKNEDELKEQAGAAVKAGADLVEWRFDFFEDRTEKGLQTGLESLHEVLTAAASEGKQENRMPLLFTIRTRQEGGDADFSFEEYTKLNLLAASGTRTSEAADLVDIEVFGEEEKKKELIKKLQEKGVKVIGSSHNFQETPPVQDLFTLLFSLADSGADILKLAVMPQYFEDVQVLILAVRKTVKSLGRPVIAMSMGEMGKVTRTWGEAFGSCLTFGTAGPASAPGQMPVAELRAALSDVHQTLQKTPLPASHCG